MISKTSTHWNNKSAKDKFRNTIAKEWVGASVITSETNFHWPSIYKPGDTAIITDRLIRSRKTKSGDDNHGLVRWSFITLQGCDERRLTLIYVYKVNSTPIDLTKINITITQKLIMIHDKLKKESIPSLTILHLITFINNLTKSYSEIIIDIDTHETFTSNTMQTVQAYWSNINKVWH